MGRTDIASLRDELDGLYDGMMGHSNPLRSDEGYRKGYRRGRNARHSIRGTRLVVTEVRVDDDTVVPIDREPEGTDPGRAA